MKKLMNKTISEKSSKIALELSKMVLFPSGLALIFACAGDGCYNGRLVLGLFLMAAAYQVSKKARKEGR